MLPASTPTRHSLCPEPQPTRRCRSFQSAALPFRRTIRRHELRQIIPLADTTIYEMERRGEFPQRFNLTPRCVVWELAEVEAWIDERKQAPCVGALKPDVRLRKIRAVRADANPAEDM